MTLIPGALKSSFFHFIKGLCGLVVTKSTYIFGSPMAHAHRENYRGMGKTWKQVAQQVWRPHRTGLVATGTFTTLHASNHRKWTCINPVDQTNRRKPRTLFDSDQSTQETCWKEFSKRRNTREWTRSNRAGQCRTRWVISPELHSLSGLA